MASYKVFVSFAVLVACIAATQAEDLPVPALSQPQVNAQPEAQTELAPEGANREKKHAIIYDAAPAIAYTYPAVPLVSSYSYQYHRSLPYAYSAAYYPYLYGPPAYIF